MEHVTIVNLAGLAIGAGFGAVGQRTGFCLMRGLQHWWLDGDRRRIGAFALALAVALVGSQALAAAGLVDLGRSLYPQSRVSWLLIPVGGALFGYGMVAANGCGARALVLLAGGNLRAFLVLVCLGVTAYAVLTGVLAPARLWLAAGTTITVPATPATVPALFANGGMAGELVRWMVVMVVAVGLAGFALAHAAVRRSPRDVWGGLAIGALVPVGWLATGWIGADDFDPTPVASLTFVAPIGASLQYLMIATGVSPDFGIATVAGVLAGATVAAVSSRTAALEGFDGPTRMLRSMAGGCLMGAGGALALGCSIGQGLTGLSTLALPSFAAAAGILLGAWAGLKGPLALPRL